MIMRKIVPARTTHMHWLHDSTQSHSHGLNESERELANKIVPAGILHQASARQAKS